jgi:hypothetical protein
MREKTLPQWGSPYQLVCINNYFNLSITAKLFNGGLGKGMHKTAHPSGGVGSLNPHR